MHIEPAAIGVLAGLLLLGYALRSTVMIALFASMPFGATAIATLTSLGGSSILLYTPLAGLLILTTLGRKSALADLRTVFASQWVAVLVAFLMVYVVVGAFILPRLFSGQTTVFLPGFGKIVEVPLTPVAGNINQSSYFIANTLCFFAFSVLFLKGANFRNLRIALFTFATVHACLCVLDLGAKLAGAGDVLAFVRTAGYSMLTEVQAEGFWRIVGAYPEASICAAASATAFAFTFSYWRMTGSRPAFALTLILVLLLLSSTSTTGYVVFASLTAVFLANLLFNALRCRLRPRDLGVVACSAVALIGLLAVALANEHALDPIAKLLQGSIFDKSTSASAAERFYWNYKSFQAFLETGGLGVGMGSSRASSWLVAVLSQLGAVGAIVFGVLVWQILRRPYRQPPRPEQLEIAATCMGIRAAAFATLVALLTSAGNADPGILFFTALAALLAGRRLLSQNPAWTPQSVRAHRPWHDQSMPHPAY